MALTQIEKAQRGVGPSKRCDTIRHVKLYFTPVAARTPAMHWPNLAEHSHGLLERAG
jgi:hypothetical protein